MESWAQVSRLRDGLFAIPTECSCRISFWTDVCVWSIAGWIDQSQPDLCECSISRVRVRKKKVMTHWYSQNLHPFLKKVKLCSLVWLADVPCRPREAGISSPTCTHLPSLGYEMRCYHTRWQDACPWFPALFHRGRGLRSQRWGWGTRLLPGSKPPCRVLNVKVFCCVVDLC